MAFAIKTFVCAECGEPEFKEVHQADWDATHNSDGHPYIAFESEIRWHSAPGRDLSAVQHTPACEQLQLMLDAAGYKVWTCSCIDQAARPGIEFSEHEVPEIWTASADTAAALTQGVTKHILQACETEVRALAAARLAQVREQQAQMERRDLAARTAGETYCGLCSTPIVVAAGQPALCAPCETELTPRTRAGVASLVRYSERVYMSMQVYAGVSAQMTQQRDLLRDQLQAMVDWRDDPLSPERATLATLLSESVRILDLVAAL